MVEYALKILEYDGDACTPKARSTFNAEFNRICMVVVGAVPIGVAGENIF